MAMNQLLIKGKQASILMALKESQQEWYISTIAKKTQTTYVHAHKFISECEKAGILSIEKHGKLKIVKLTEKGNRIAESLKEIYMLIGMTEAAKETL